MTLATVTAAPALTSAAVQDRGSSSGQRKEWAAVGNKNRVVFSSSQLWVRLAAHTVSDARSLNFLTVIGDWNEYVDGRVAGHHADSW